MNFQSLQQVYSQKIHISDSSAGKRWLWSLLACLILAPFAGSFLTFAVAIMSVFALMNHVFDRQKVLPNKTEWLMAMIILSYLAVGLIFAVTRAEPMKGWVAVSSNAAFILFLPLIPVITRNADLNWNNQNWLELMLTALALGSIITTLVAFLEAQLIDPSRLEALTGNPLILAYSNAMSGIICWHFFFRTNGMLKTLLLVGFICAILTQLGTAGRSSLVAMLLCSTIIAIASVKPKHLKQISIAAICLLALILALRTLFDTHSFSNAMTVRVQSIFEYLFSMFSKLETSNLGIEERKVLFVGGVNAFLAAPFLGYGRQHVMEKATEFLPANLHQTFEYTHLHNGYLTEAVASGVLGLITFVAVLMLPIIVTWYAALNIRILALGITVLTMIIMATNIGFYHDVMISVFGFWVMVCWILANNYKAPNRFNQSA